MQPGRRIELVGKLGCRGGSQTRRHLFVFRKQPGEILFVQNGGPLQKIEKFPDVARIIVCFQNFDLFRCQPVLVLLEPVAVGDLFDVAFTLPQRRHQNLYHVQPVKQIFPEFPVAHHRRKIAVGRRNQPDIHLDLLAAAQPDDASRCRPAG